MPTRFSSTSFGGAGVPFGFAVGRGTVIVPDAAVGTGAGAGGGVTVCAIAGNAAHDSAIVNSKWRFNVGDMLLAALYGTGDRYSGVGLA